MDLEKLKKLQAQAGAGRIGGKGTPRRKVVAKPRKVEDDKKIAAGLKKIGVQPMTGVEEVNMFQDDGTVLRFAQPRVHSLAQANTAAIYGTPTTHSTQELIQHGILNQMGLNNLRDGEGGNAKQLEMLKRMLGAAGQGRAEEDDDEAPPELVAGDDDAPPALEEAAAAPEKNSLEELE